MHTSVLSAHHHTLLFEYNNLLLTLILSISDLPWILSLYWSNGCRSRTCGFPNWNGNYWYQQWQDFKGLCDLLLLDDPHLHLFQHSPTLFLFPCTGYRRSYWRLWGSSVLQIISNSNGKWFRGHRIFNVFWRNCWRIPYSITLYFE